MNANPIHVGVGAWFYLCLPLFWQCLGVWFPNRPTLSVRDIDRSGGMLHLRSDVVLSLYRRLQDGPTNPVRPLLDKP
jgi:hypothetical protein